MGNIFWCLPLGMKRYASLPCSAQTLVGKGTHFERFNFERFRELPRGRFPYLTSEAEWNKGYGETTPYLGMAASCLFANQCRMAPFNEDNGGVKVRGGLSGRFTLVSLNSKLLRPPKNKKKTFVRSFLPKNKGKQHLFQ